MEGHEAKIKNSPRKGLEMKIKKEAKRTKGSSSIAIYNYTPLNTFRAEGLMCVKKFKSDLLIVQIYIDNIIFGATNHCLCEDFAKTMKGEFKMSMMGELKFFLRLQIKQGKDGISIN